MFKMLFENTFRKIQKTNNRCGTDQLFAYFIGLLGLSGIVYTYLHVITLKHADILYLDRETLRIQRGNQFSVLYKRMNTNIELLQHNGTNSLDYKPLDVKDSKGVNSEGDKLRQNSSENKFLLNGTELTHMFRSDERTKRMKRCNKLFDRADNAFIDSVLYMEAHKRKSITNNQYRAMTSDCNIFKRMRSYIESPITELERNFPLAYSILAYKDVEQIERLLRAIYRPQNYYCVHLDNKTSQDDVTTMKSISDCFPNVFISSRSLDIKWGEFSVLEAELVCMKDLWAKKGWKYFINLTGQEFPLKTNLEIVSILSAMKGGNLVDGTWVRARKNYFYRWTKSGKQPPHKIRPIKGSVHVCVNRDFVDFALHDYRSKDFLEWLKDTEIPDETFFSSLNHNPHLQIPGTFLGEPEEYPQKPTFTRYKNWEIGHGVWARKCSGKYVHNICILGTGDLYRLKNDISLFANKFHMDFQYLAYDCMEAMVYNRTRDQYLNRRSIDVSFYAMLDQVKLRLVKPSDKRSIEH